MGRPFTLSYDYPYFEIVAADTFGVTAIAMILEQNWCAEARMLAEKSRLASKVFGTSSAVAGIWRSNPKESVLETPDLRILVGLVPDQCDTANTLLSKTFGKDAVPHTISVCPGTDGVTLASRGSSGSHLLRVPRHQESDAIIGVLGTMFLPGVISFDLNDLYTVFRIGNQSIFAMGASNGKTAAEQATRLASDHIANFIANHGSVTALLCFGGGTETTSTDVLKAFHMFAELCPAWAEDPNTKILVVCWIAADYQPQEVCAYIYVR